MNNNDNKKINDVFEWRTMKLKRKFYFCHYIFIIKFNLFHQSKLSFTRKLNIKIKVLHILLKQLNKNIHHISTTKDATIFF